MTFRTDPTYSRAAIDDERGVRAERSVRDVGPGEIHFKLIATHPPYGRITASAQVESANNGKLVRYTFSLAELRRRALHVVSLTLTSGTTRPLSLEECKIILAEAVPLLERSWQQCSEDSGLVVEVIFSNDG